MRARWNMLGSLLAVGVVAAACKSNSIDQVNGACTGAFQDCAHTGRCETNTDEDTTNCGACGAVCSSRNGAPSCAAGRCAIACNAGFGDCNANVADGCETSTATDEANCGGCGAACSTNHASEACSAGKCSITSCASGFADCDGDPKDGCEGNTQTGGFHLCAGACADSTSPNTCGTMCTPCTTAVANAAPSCAMGACSYRCTAGFSPCGVACLDLTKDAANCGACGHDCAGATCSGSKCQPLTLASGVNGIELIAFDATYVFYTTSANDGIWQVPKLGGAAPKQLVTLSGVHVTNLATAGTTVYWSATQQVFSMSDTGAGSPATVLAGPVNGFATNGTELFFWNNTCGVESAALDGTGPSALMSFSPCYGNYGGLAAGSTRVAAVYLAMAGAAGWDLVSGPLTPSSGTQLENNASLAAAPVWIWSSYVYYAGPSLAGANDAAWTRELAVGGGQPQTVPCLGPWQSNLVSPPTHALAFDAAYVYCIDPTKLGRQALDLTTGEVDLYTGSQLTALAVDDRFAYVGDSGASKLVRVPTQ